MVDSIKPMEPLPVSCDSKLNRQHHTSLTFELIEPTSMLRTQIRLAKPTGRVASFAASLQPSNPMSPPRRTVYDSEIGVFDAEKYYGGLHDQKVNGTAAPEHSALLSSVPASCRLSSLEDGYGRKYRTRSFHATPTAPSEASWNSQTGLLSNPSGSAPMSIKKIPGTVNRSTRCSSWFARPKCPCSGEKAVEVKHADPKYRIQRKAQRNRSNSLNSSFCSNANSSRHGSHAAYAAKGTTSTPPYDHDHRTGNFTFRPQSSEHSKNRNQIRSPNLKGFSPGIHGSSGQNQAVRASFAVSNGNGNGNGAAAATTTTINNGFTFPVLSTRRSFDAVTGVVDDPPRDSLEVFQPRERQYSAGGKETSRHLSYPLSPKSRRKSYDEENGSDASSDLFEIESITTQTTWHPRRHSTEDGRRLGGGTGNDGVDPRRSIGEPMTPSECYAPSEASVVWSVTTAEGFDDGGDGADGGKRGGNGGLLNCRHEKAVSVDPGPIKHGAGMPVEQKKNTGGENGWVRPSSSVGRPPLGRSTLGF